MSILTPVKVPRELLAVNQAALEDYVRNRLLQFVRGLGQRLLQLAPETNPAVLDRAVRDVLDVLPLPDYGLVPLEMLELQLVFRHDCLALGCTEPQCVLCQHNSQRRCTVNFNKKYLVNDKMVARCGAQIRIEVVDRATGKLYDGDMSEVYLELFILDGAQYDQKFLGEKGRAYQLAGAAGAEQADAELDTCALLLNNKSTPLIASLTGGRSDDLGRLLLQTQHGRLTLPDVVITDSSEALLSGRKPPFRLVARARHVDGRRLKMRHAVSEPFVVATRRVRASHKVEIPSMDDPVSKLDHMGRETVRKLADLPAAAAQAGVMLDLEPELHRIGKVKQFKALALKAESEGHLRQQLQTLLKLPKDKWDEAAEHAKRAVVPDNRQRAWYADRTNMDLGLLFPCRLGVVDLKRPEALLQRTVGASGASRVEVIVQTRQSPMQRDIVRQLLPQAESSWWAPGHVGWTIFAAEADADSSGVGTTNARTVFDQPMAGAGSNLNLAAMDAAAAAAQPAAAAASVEGAVPGSVPVPLGAVANHAVRNNTGQHQAQHAQHGIQQLLPPTIGFNLHSLMAAHAAAGGPTSAAAATNQADLLSLQQLNALLLSAGMAGAPGAGQQLQHDVLLAQQQQQQQQQELHPPQNHHHQQQQQQQWQQKELQPPQQQQKELQPPQQQQQHSFVLPSSAELERMMQSRSLTEEVVAQITAAYEANACPPDILAVLQSHITEDAGGADCGTAVAAAAAGSDSRSGGNGGPSSPTAGVKRTRSAAAFSSYSSGGLTSGDAAPTPAATAAGGTLTNASGAAGQRPAAAAGGIMQQDSLRSHAVKRPASFSGAAGVGRTSSMSEAAAAAVSHRTASCNLPPTKVQQQQQEPTERAAAEAAGQEPHPFYEQLRRDSGTTKTPPAAAAAASGGSDGGGWSQDTDSPPSSFATAADEAIRAVQEADAAAAATPSKRSDLAAVAAAAVAAAASGRGSGHSSGVNGPPAAAAAAGTRPDAAGSLSAALLPGQSLDVPGLCAAYPSVLLDALLASAAVSRNAAAGIHSRQGGAGAAAAAGVFGVSGRASRADSGCVQADLEVMLESSGLNHMQTSAKQAAALPLESLSSLGLLDHLDAALGGQAPGKAAAAGTAAAGSGAAKPDSKTQLSTHMSVELMDGMSFELPSGLLHLSNSLLDGRTSLQPQASLLTVFGKAPTGSGVGGLKQMSLELPSSVLNLGHNHVLADDAAEKDTCTTSAAAAAGAAQPPPPPTAAAATDGSSGLGSKASSGILGWDRLGSLGNSASLPFLASTSTGSAARARRESGLDVIGDMGQALDEIMSAEKMQS